MNFGIVYFIQPKEYLGTDKYKIGCTRKSNLNRCSSYGINTRFIVVLECINPFEVESLIKHVLRRTYKLRSIQKIRLYGTNDRTIIEML